MSDKDVVRAITDNELQAWLEFFAADNAASNRPEIPQSIRDERRFNRVVLRVNGRGFKYAFMEISRRYSEKTNTTRITTRLLSYDGKRRVVNAKKSLSKVATGDKTWKASMNVNQTNIPATWRNDRPMSQHESDAWDSAISTVIAHNLWGRNDLVEHIKAFATSHAKFALYESTL